MKAELTRREREIIELIALDHLVAKQIASLLLISLETVNGHVKNIKSKLNIHTQSELVSYYYSQRFNFKKLSPIWRKATIVSFIVAIVILSIILADSKLADLLKDGACNFQSLKDYLK